MDKKKRKYQNTLIIAGRGIILFGVWNILKFLMMYFFAGDMLTDTIVAYTPEIETEFIRNVVSIAFIVIALIYIAFDFLLRVYVGRCAKAAGRGEKTKKTYIVIASLMLVISLVSDIFGLFSITEGISVTDTIVSIVVDLTSCYILADLIWASVRLIQIEKGENNAG